LSTESSSLEYQEACFSIRLHRATTSLNKL